MVRVNGDRLQKMTRFPLSFDLYSKVLMNFLLDSLLPLRATTASALLLDFLNAWPQIESVLAPLASELAMNAAHPPDQALPLPGQHHSKKKLAGSIAKGPVVRA
jgi:hypothetical protein